MNDELFFEIDQTHWIVNKSASFQLSTALCPHHFSSDCKKANEAVTYEKSTTTG